MLRRAYVYAVCNMRAGTRIEMLGVDFKMLAASEQTCDNGKQRDRICCKCTRERERDMDRLITSLMSKIYSCIRTFHSCYNRIFRTKIYNRYSYKLISYHLGGGLGLFTYL